MSQGTEEVFLVLVSFLKVLTRLLDHRVLMCRLNHMKPQSFCWQRVNDLFICCYDQCDVQQLSSYQDAGFTAICLHWTLPNVVTMNQLVLEDQIASVAQPT